MVITWPAVGRVKTPARLAEPTVMAWRLNGRGAAGAGSRPRRSERYRTNGLTCPLGDVVDLSGTGMRVRSSVRPPVKHGDVTQLSLASDSQRLVVAGRIAWVRRTSWRAFEAGIQFLDMTAASSAAVVQLAKYGFVGARDTASGGAPPRVRATMQVEDLYEILGVPPGASADEIANAYRKLALQYHPDVCKEPDAAARFALTSKAYSVLRDPERRRRYDALAARCEAA